MSKPPSSKRRRDEGGDDDTENMALIQNFSDLHDIHKTLTMSPGVFPCPSESPSSDIVLSRGCYFTLFVNAQGFFLSKLVQDVLSPRSEWIGGADILFPTVMRNKLKCKQGGVLVEVFGVNPVVGTRCVPKSLEHKRGIAALLTRSTTKSKKKQKKHAKKTAATTAATTIDDVMAAKSLEPKTERALRPFNESQVQKEQESLFESHRTGFMFHGLADMKAVEAAPDMLVLASTQTGRTSSKREVETKAAEKLGMDLAKTFRAECPWEKKLVIEPFVMHHTSEHVTHLIKISQLHARLPLWVLLNIIQGHHPNKLVDVYVNVRDGSIWFEYNFESSFDGGWTTSIVTDKLKDATLSSRSVQLTKEEVESADMWRTIREFFNEQRRECRERGIEIPSHLLLFESSTSHQDLVLKTMKQEIGKKTKIAGEESTEPTVIKRRIVSELYY